MGGRRQTVVSLFDELRLREALFQVAKSYLYLCGQILVRFVNHGDLGVVLSAVKPRCPVIHRAPSVQQRLQNLVVYLDLLYSFSGRLFFFGCHQSDPVSHEAHALVE